MTKCANPHGLGLGSLSSLAIALMTVAAGPAHAVTISTTQTGKASDFSVSQFGNAANYNRVVGQSFTVTSSATSQLQSFTFRLDDIDSGFPNLFPGQTNFRAFVIEYNSNSGAAGSLLYSSPGSLSTSSSSSGFHGITATPAAPVTLTVGGEYIAFFFTDDQTGSSLSEVGISGSASNDAYTGGTAFLGGINRPAGASQFENNSLLNGYKQSDFDLAFELILIPEPGTAIAMLAGVALGVMRRRHAA